ncbi:glycosyltransferase family 2 protein [Candidatus Aciduliprofundum boonei]|uniref:Glycosyl transferase family 2 n=1 Tax=Aciduliprofundum boonei (strain DSM 19572 / T469) TaxID=439481 RepID=B5IDI7_ACIB4|nr:glycosyltransferase family 2 protein [Candidatus Aciduliprofundum boonei]ADD08062.1 glycosyl transferase family 2 [Aciduliprofundum boonei T469]EDY35570.1 glycosyl transferase, group 2 family protein [Aciduliprofundum boonei T469]
MTNKRLRKPKVSIIILNWNGWRDTIECLESVYQLDYPNYDVVVVDNASTDDSIQKIKKYAKGGLPVKSKFFNYNPTIKPISVFEIDENGFNYFNLKEYERINPNKRMIVIKNHQNYGYAGGNNIGIEFALHYLNPEYIYILNNDVVVEKNNLKELVKVFSIDTKIGFVSPIQLYYDKPEIVNNTGAEIIFSKAKSTHLNNGINISKVHISTKEIPSLSGAAMLVKKEVFKKVGVLNDFFFLYWEETEFIFRAKKFGYKAYMCGRTKIWHKVSVSTKKINLTVLYFDNRNRIIVSKQYAKNKELFLLCLYLIYEIIKFALSSIVKYHSIKRFFVYIHGIFSGLIF